MDRLLYFCHGPKLMDYHPKPLRNYSNNTLKAVNIFLNWNFSPPETWLQGNPNYCFCSVSTLSRWFRIFLDIKVSRYCEGWDSQQGRARTTSILVRAFWNFKRKVLKYPRNCSLHNTLISNLVKPLIYIV